MYTPPLIFGPIAPENNPPIEPQFYSPSLFNISAITLGHTTTITTVLDNNFVVGQLVRIIMPIYFGCRQLNEQTGIVISIPAANQVVLNIDSTLYDTFVANPTSDTTQPQIIPIGDFNSGLINNNGRIQLNSVTIPGAFINISP
jgi:hypothetical protein